jgi:hypothetical protein
MLPAGEFSLPTVGISLHRMAQIIIYLRTPAFSPDSAAKSERGANLEQRRHSTVKFQSLFSPARSSIYLRLLGSTLTAAAFSEAKRIVFAAEGLFLAHAFPFYRGIRVQFACKRTALCREHRGFVRGNNLDLRGSVC